MAPPDLIEWSPISSFVKPRVSGPINSTTARSLGSAWDEFMHDIFPSDEVNVHNLESLEAPGMRSTLLIVNAAAFTGHNRLSSVLNMCTE